MASDETIAEAMGFLEAVYPAARLRSQSIGAYAELLADVPDQILRTTVRNVASRHQYFPSASELLEAIRSTEPAQDPMTRTEQIWQDFFQPGAQQATMLTELDRLAAVLAGSDRPCAAEYVRDRRRRIERIRVEAKHG